MICNNMDQLNSHSDSKELVFGGGDDHVGLAQHSQVILFTGQETPVQDVTVQQTSGLQEDLCRITGGEEEETYRKEKKSSQLIYTFLFYKVTKHFSLYYYKLNDSILINNISHYVVSVISTTQYILSCYISLIAL